MSAGLLLGFHNESDYLTIDNCTECDLFGKQVELLNKGFIYVEKNKDKWIN